MNVQLHIPEARRVPISRTRLPPTARTDCVARSGSAPSRWLFPPPSLRSRDDAVPCAGGNGIVSITSITSLLEIEPVSAGTVSGGLPGEDGPAVATAVLPTAAVPTPLRLRVVWGDLALQPADIHVVGHYEGVLPCGSEAALDRAISLSPERGLIAEHTRRRWLVGHLGEITYFPGLTRTRDGSAVVVHKVAVAGLGRPGTFSEANAEQFYASVFRELTSLPQVETVAMALIGVGAGNLSISRAAGALKKGFSTVMAAVPSAGPWPEILVVVRDRLLAEQVTVALSTPQDANFLVDSQVEVGVDGGVGPGSAAVFALRALARALQKEVLAEQGAPRPATSLRALLSDELPEHLRLPVLEQLGGISDDISQLDIRVGPQADEAAVAPTRISVTDEGDRMRWAALTDWATVPERQVPVNRNLVSELRRRLTAPSAADAGTLPKLLRRWVVPEDFQDHINTRAPIVLEVNGGAAQIPWEFLTDAAFDSGEEAWPLALRTPIARQLRTAYAKATIEREDHTTLRALVIADPGRSSLPGARQEGRTVAGLLRARGLSVQLFLGSPVTPPDESEQWPEGTPPVPARAATQLDVLKELLTGDYDIVHYAGHGVMPDPAHPEQSGWLFSDGVLSARELGQLTLAPRLVTANACWTAYTIGNAADVPEMEGRTRLTAVLAEEFLRAGVTHFIGTSWAIPDGSALRFARSLYEQLLPAPDTFGETIGRAVLEARRQLYGERPPDPTNASPEAYNAWAAYQHYGDPADVLDRLHPPPSDALVPRGDETA